MLTGFVNSTSRKFYNGTKSKQNFQKMDLAISTLAGFRIKKPPAPLSSGRLLLSLKTWSSGPGQRIMALPKPFKSA